MSETQTVESGVEFDYEFIFKHRIKGGRSSIGVPEEPDEDIYAFEATEVRVLTESFDPSDFGISGEYVDLHEIEEIITNVIEQTLRDALK